MFEFLQQVRLTVIKPGYLAKIIANFPACKSSFGCQQLISNAELYHSNPSVCNVVDVGEIKPRGFPSGKIYVVGEDSIQTFDNAIFREFVRMDIGVEGRGSAAIDNKIYTTGGWVIPFVEDAYLLTNQVSVYSLEDNNSTKLMPAMNCNRGNHACCSHAGDLFVCGGKDGRFSTCCEKLIIKEGKWKFVAKMNEARTDFQVVSLGKYIWAIGGEGQGGSVLNITEYYDDVTDKWTNSNPMIEKRHGHSAVAFREEIFVIGGEDGFGRLSSAEKLNTTTEQWTAISSMKVVRAFFGAAINENKLYCFGDNVSIEAKVEYFDLYRGTWMEEGAILLWNRLDSSAVTVYDV